MSENVNILIEKMNQEHLRKKRIGPAGRDASRPGTHQINTKERELENNDKAIRNLIREH